MLEKIIAIAPAVAATSPLLECVLKTLIVIAFTARLKSAMNRFSLDIARPAKALAATFATVNAVKPMNIVRA